MDKNTGSHNKNKTNNGDPSHGEIRNDILNELNDR